MVYATDNPDAPDRRILRHFFAWREQIVTIEHLGAFRTTARNLVTGDATPEPIPLAEVMASAFTVAQTPPLLGRFLLSDDERAGAPRVIVIGHRSWQTRFGGDPAIIGRTIGLDSDRHEVIGVMPEGFRFSFNHEYWVPLRVTATQYGPFEGPLIVGICAAVGPARRSMRLQTTEALRECAASGDNGRASHNRRHRVRIWRWQISSATSGRT